jgi:hypothetical protein
MLFSRKHPCRKITRGHCARPDVASVVALEMPETMFLPTPGLRSPARPHPEVRLIDFDLAGGEG